MKNSLIALCTALLLSSCAGTKIVHTDVATGATNPRAIYIRPFDITYADYIGHHAGGIGERPIRRSLAPAEFATDLRNELDKIAPAMVLKDNEIPHVGWLVTGDFVLVDAGNPVARAFFVAGRSRVKIHVRVIDLEATNTRADSKDADASKEQAKGRGNIIYEFDVAGGSRFSGSIGSLYAPGTGYSVPFDFKNAADKIGMALTPDPLRLGDRPTTIVR